MASSFPNYLRSFRKRFAFGQDEVAFLLGVKGSDIPSRHERFEREPSLPTALAYEIIYQKPLKELFPGLYDDVQRGVVDRAKTLLGKGGASHSDKRQLLARISEMGAPNL